MWYKLHCNSASGSTCTRGRGCSGFLRGSTDSPLYLLRSSSTTTTTGTSRNSYAGVGVDFCQERFLRRKNGRTNFVCYTRVQGRKISYETFRRKIRYVVAPFGLHVQDVKCSPKSQKSTKCDIASYQRFDHELEPQIWS